MSIPDLIAAVSERLTPTERRIAAAVLADPTLLAFGTVSDLAELVGTSRPSIVRFGTKLGFEGYADLQSHVQSSMSAQLSRPSQRIRHQEDSLEPSRQALSEALASAFAAIEGKRLAQLVAPIAKAKSVWILSGETSRAGAHALFSGLSIVRPNVRLIDDHGSAGALSGAARGDTAVVLDFPRYRRHVINAATALAEHGIKLVAITDGPLSPLASLTKTWCPLKIPAIGPFDSSVPTVALAELLVAGVAAKLHKQASQRIDRTEALWQATDTFLD
jgi:DNA-binding MurR/RpiR family transcriptional regulator